jgi:hypothetical protein
LLGENHLRLDGQALGRLGGRLGRLTDASPKRLHQVDDVLALRPFLGPNVLAGALLIGKEPTGFPAILNPRIGKTTEAAMSRGHKSSRAA